MRRQMGQIGPFPDEVDMASERRGTGRLEGPENLI